MVQYYRDLWAKRREMLAPLTDLVGECGQTKVTRAKGTKKVPWHWDEVHQKAFDTVKATIAKDVVLAYPNYDKVFEVYTDASSTQLGSVITQSNRPLAFFSRKLSETQQKYSVTEIELLAIVETLKEFKGMLWGQKLVVYTDHQNLMRDALGLTSDRVYRWRLILEEYGPEIVYIKGIDNTVADAISRLDFTPVPPSSQKEQQNWMTFTKCWCALEKDTHEFSEQQHLTSMSQVFANHSKDEEIFPITVKEIARGRSCPKSCKTRPQDSDKTRSCLATPVLQDRQDLVCTSKTACTRRGRSRSVWLVFSSRQKAIGINISEVLHTTTVYFIATLQVLRSCLVLRLRKTRQEVLQDFLSCDVKVLDRTSVV